LFSQEGKLLWKHHCGHAQHIIIGDFRTDLSGKEVCCLDRGNDRSITGIDAMVMYSCNGKELWRERRRDSGGNRRLTIISTVKNWDGRSGDLILAYRRGGSISPTLYDGYGKVVATFPFPNPENQHFVHHADICGDGKEDILIWNENEIWIYESVVPYKQVEHITKSCQSKRLYNWSHYIGMP